MCISLSLRDGKLFVLKYKIFQNTYRLNLFWVDTQLISEGWMNK